jgi:hypothetical protein
MGSRRAAELAKRVDNEKWLRITLASASVNYRYSKEVAASEGIL